MLHLSASRETLIVSLANQEKRDALLFKFTDGQWVRVGSVLSKGCRYRSEVLWRLSKDEPSMQFLDHMMTKGEWGGKREIICNW